MNEGYVLIRSSSFDSNLLGVCFKITQDIIETYQNYETATLAKRDITLKNVIEDFSNGWNNKRDFDNYFSSPSFNQQLFLEVLWFVFAWADSFLQSSKDKEIWLQLRSKTQHRLYSTLQESLKLTDEQTKQLDNDLVIRSEQYSITPSENSITLMSYINGLIKGNAKIFSIAAWEYSLVALGEMIGKRAIINKLDKVNEYEILCRNCLTTLKGSTKDLPFTVLCEKCKASFNIENSC